MAQLDPSLIGGFKPIDIPDPTNMLMKAMQIQHLQSQTQMANLEMQKAQATADETNQLRQYLSDPATAAMDPASRMAGIQRVAPITGTPIVKSMLEAQQAQGTMQKTGLDNHATQIKIAGQIFGAAAQAGPQAVMDAFKGIPESIMPAEVKQQLAAQFQADPVGTAKRMQQQAMSANEQVTQNNPTILPTESGIAAVNRDGSGGRMVPNVMGAATYQNGTPGVGPGIAPIQGQPQGQPNGVNWEATLRAGLDNPDPAVRKEMQMRLAQMTPGLSPNFAQGGPAAPQGAPQPVAQALGAKPSGTWEVDPTTGQRVYAPKFATPGDTLNPGGNVKLSDQDKLLAKQIASYDMAPMSSMALHNPHNAAIMAEVVAQNPAFDATRYTTKQQADKAFATGQQGNSLRSFAVATDHLDTLGQLVGALKNGDYPLINRLSQVVATQTGGTAATNFDTAKDIVSKEVIKAIVGGGGGVSEREDLAKRMNAASSPKQLLEQIDYYKTLMGAQRDALVHQYENTTGRTDAAARFNFGKGAAPASPVPDDIRAIMVKHGVSM